MYLNYFGLQQLPFHLTPNTELFLGLPPHYEALQTVQAALDMGEGVIKVIGEVGTGKTMVCRMLIEQFSESIQLVYLPNPALTDFELRQAIAHELGVQPQQDSIVDAIQNELIRLKQTGKKVVILVDEAQALSDEALEALRLFGNLETATEKLLSIVLLAQPELEQRLTQHHLRQLRQRITFSASLRALTQQEVSAYIDKRIEKSGCPRPLFSGPQKKAVFQASQGIPRLVNQICHKALLLAFNAGGNSVSNGHLFDAIHDTFDTQKPKFKRPVLWGWTS